MKTGQGWLLMSQDKEKTGPQKLVSVLVIIARFSTPISILVFLILSYVLGIWLSRTVAVAISAWLVSLPFYWLIPKPRFGYPAYVLFCAILAAFLAFIEHLLIP